MLQALARRVREQHRILLNKKVTGADHSADGVTVRCADGTSYRGDILAGADGIWSKVRQEMWRVAEASDPGAISSKEKNGKLESRYVSISTPQLVSSFGS